MRLIMRLLLAALVMSSLSLNTWAETDTVLIQGPDLVQAPTCDQVIGAADKTIQDKQRQIDIRDLQIKQQQDVMADQAKRIGDSESVLKAPWLWMALGAVIGGYVAGRRQ